MLLNQFFSNANWLAIGVAALTYYALGALWYSLLFQKAWVAGHKIEMPTTDEGKAAMKKSMPMIMISGLLMNIVMTVLIGMLVMALGSTNCMAGIKLGLALSVIGAVPLVMSHLYMMKPFKLWIIDGGYHVVGITLASIIISVWH